MDKYAQEYSKSWMTVLLDYWAWMQCSTVQLYRNAVSCCRKSDRSQIRLSSSTSMASCLIKCDRLCLVNTWMEDVWRRFMDGRKKSCWLNIPNASHLVQAEPKSVRCSAKYNQGCWWSCCFQMWCTAEIQGKHWVFKVRNCDFSSSWFLLKWGFHHVVLCLHFNDQWNVF